MRIVYISASKIPSQEANSVHSMNMCDAFEEKGHEVTFIIPGNKNEKGINDNVFKFYNTRNKFKIIRFYWPNYRYSSLINNLRLACFLKKRKPDLVYSRFPSIGLFAPLFKLKTIYEYHRPLNRNPGKILQKVLNSKYLLRIVVISKALKEINAGIMARIDSKTIVAHDSANKVFHKYSIFDKSTIHIGYIGSLYKGRGIDIIIQLAKNNPSCCFHVIGGRDDEIQYWKEQFNGEKIKNLIFYGFKNQSEIIRYINSCDILLAPYQRDLQIAGGGSSTVDYMSPLKVFEYMSSGKAIVSSDFPVLREILKDGVNCFLVEPDNIDKWDERIKLLVSNNVLRIELGANALNDFENNYTWDKRVEFILENL